MMENKGQVSSTANCKAVDNWKPNCPRFKKKKETWAMQYCHSIFIIKELMRVDL